MRRSLVIVLLILTGSLAFALEDPRVTLMLATARQVADTLVKEHVDHPTPQQVTAWAWQGIRAAAGDQPGLPAQVSDWTELEQAFRRAATTPQRAAVLAEGALRSMVDGVGDPYSTLLTPEQRAWEDQVRKTGQFTGIGVELAYRKGLVVVACLDGSPAARAGLRAGDRLLAIDGRSLDGLTFYEAGNLLLGRAGTTVRLKLLGNGSPAEVSVTRAPLTLPEVGYQLLAPGVGYVRIGYFGEDTAGKVRSCLEQLTSRGAKGLVLDLRNNPGGDFQQGLQVAGLFASGALVRVERPGQEPTRVVVRSQPPWTAPVAVVVNRGTASAAEIVALALKGRPGRTIVGEKTFGKSRIQTMYALAGGGAVNLSTGRYLPLDGSDLDGVGLTPDVPGGADPIATAAARL